MAEHWSSRLDINEAVVVGTLIDYEPEPALVGRVEYMLGLSCELIKLPYHTLATGYEMARSFVTKARSLCAMAV